MIGSPPRGSGDEEEDAIRNIRVLAGLLALLAFWAAGGPGDGPAVAASFTVGSEVDAVDANPGDGVCASAAGECTLRAAIQETNAMGGADTINVPAGTYPLNIPGTSEDAGATGDLDITDDLAITGGSRSDTIIDGNGVDRVFQTLDPDDTVEVTGLRIQGGKSVAGEVGGGVFNAATLALTDTDVIGNSSAGGGGGVDNSGELLLTRVSVSNNTTGSVGGGLTNFSFALDATTTLIDSTVNGNTAAVIGGGIYNQGVFLLNGSSVSVNRAGGDGGGIFVNAGTLTAVGSTIDGNSAAGLFGDGGGVYISELSTVQITDSSIADNTAIFDGGGILSAGDLTLTNSTLSSNIVCTNGGCGGGGFHSYSIGTTTISGTRIADNTGTGINNGAVLRLSDSTVSGNSDGGISNGGTAEVESVEVSGNTAISGGGITNGARMILTNSVIRANTASGGDGGGIFNEGDLAASDTTIADNSADDFGGGVANFLRGVLMLRNSTISGNNAGADGGGIEDSFSGGAITLTNTTITGNRAGGAGGGIEKSFGGKLSLLNVTLANNTAASAGAIFDDGRGGGTTLANTIISSPADANCIGPITSSGHNAEQGNSCGLAGPGDLTNIDPLVGPLADNGGATQTQSLSAGSPAIDSGDQAACPVTDQRGLRRPADGDGDGSARCDIGAYEAADVPVATPSPSPTPDSTPSQLPLTGGLHGSRGRRRAWRERAGCAVARYV